MSDVVTREHSSAMSMQEFVGWFSTNFGTMGIESVLRQAAFMLCCDVLAQDMANADLQLRERMDAGTSRVVSARKHPVAAFLAGEPNSRHTWFEFKEMMGLWGALTQNAYAVIRRTVQGDLIEAIPLQTGRVQERVVESDYAVFYEVTASTQQELALLRTPFMNVPERDMIHVRGRMLDGLMGYSTLVAGEKTLETGKAMDEYRDRLFADEGQLRGVFTRDKEGALDPEAFLRLRSQFKTMMRRWKQSEEPIVLEDGLKFQTVSSNPSDMELTKQFEAQIIQTCRLLRMPPHKIFHVSDTKYDNMETQEKMYLKGTLEPFVRRFEERYSRMLLTSKERSQFFIWHDRDQMVVRDTKLETERLYRLLTTGVITIDEGRARIGLNPLPNGAGKVRLIPANMYMINDRNEVLIGTQAGQSQSQDTTDDPQEDQPADGEDPTAKVLRLVSG